MGVADSPLHDRVIFVLGAPRSGTTWLLTLLATHPQIAGVGAESHLFDFGVDRLFDNFEHRDPKYHGLRRYVERDELVDLVRDVCDGILVRMRSHVAAGSEFVVEKTPIADGIDGLDLERKRECYPDAWFVHIVRDREAVTRSLMRAPWMSDRSHDACAALWDRTVGHARSKLSDLPRYHEVSYEELRSDPAAGCRELFDWLGVRAGDDVLETVRVLSREQVSDLGAVPADEPTTASSLAAIPRRAARRVRAGLRQPPATADEALPGAAAPFFLVRAMFDQDPDTLRSLTAPAFELVYRAPDEALSLRGDEGREAFVRIAADTFERKYVTEWWAAPGVQGSEWWTTIPGVPFGTIFFSAVGGDATRVDLAIGLVLEGELIRRAVLVSAGPRAGRPVIRRNS